MKNFLKILLIVGAFISPYLADAHILKTDGNIGIILHVNPEDDPIVGEVANLFFEIKDKEEKFNLAMCDCTVKILKSGEEIYSAPLSLAMDYVFRDKGVYQVQVEGRPKAGTEFQVFSTRYDFRVARESSGAEGEGGHSHNWLYAFIGGLVLLFALAIFWKNKSGKIGISLWIIFLLVGFLLHQTAFAQIHNHQQFKQDLHHCCFPEKTLDVPPLQLGPPVVTFIIKQSREFSLDVGVFENIKNKSPPSFSS